MIHDRNPATIQYLVANKCLLHQLLLDIISALGKGKESTVSDRTLSYLQKTDHRWQDVHTAVREISMTF
jgi:hypothetical protein